MSPVTAASWKEGLREDNAGPDGICGSCLKNGLLLLGCLFFTHLNQ